MYIKIKKIYTYIKDMYAKSPKLINVILIVSCAIFLFQLGKCNRERSQIVTIDNTKVEQLKSENAAIKLENDSLKAIILISQNKNKLLSKSIELLKAAHQQSNEQINVLPIDEGCELMQSNILSPVTKLSVKGQISVSIEPEAVKVINVCYNNLRFADALNDTLNRQLLNYQYIEYNGSVLVGNLEKQLLNETAISKNYLKTIDEIQTAYLSQEKKLKRVKVVRNGALWVVVALILALAIK